MAKRGGHPSWKLARLGSWGARGWRWGQAGWDRPRITRGQRPCPVSVLSWDESVMCRRRGEYDGGPAARSRAVPTGAVGVYVDDFAYGFLSVRCLVGAATLLQRDTVPTAFLSAGRGPAVYLCRFCGLMLVPNFLIQPVAALMILLAASVQTSLFRG